MTRLIDANALKYEPHPRDEINFHPYNLDDAYEDGYDDAFENVRNAPTIDAEPVRHGKWIPNEDEDGEHYGDKCSECGEWYFMPYGKTNFCPNCGARMEEE